MTWICYLKTQTVTSDLSSFCYSLTPIVEPINDKELFLDLGPHNPLSIVKKITAKASLACLGLSQSKFLAKAVCLLSPGHWELLQNFGLKYIAAKGTTRENSCLLIPAGKEKNIAGHLPVSALWPVPKKTIIKLQALGLKTLSDIARLPLTVLVEQFGSTGYLLHKFSLGQDTEKVHPLFPPPELTWEQEIRNVPPANILNMVAHGARTLAELLAEQHLGCTQVSLTITVNNRTFTGKRSFNEPKSCQTSLVTAAKALFWQQNACNVEKIALKVSGLTVPTREQLLLFSPAKADCTGDKTARLSRVCDTLVLKYQPGIIGFGRNFIPTRREKMLALWDPLRSKGEKNHV